MTKLKQGRFWFIRCKYPIPRKEEFEPWKLKESTEEALKKAFQPRLRPLRQPLYDNSEISPVKTVGMTLFSTSGKPGAWGYFWMSENKEVIWVFALNKATRFDTRESAESTAFELTAIAPWLIGHLEIYKTKVERES